jgi:hypothetical protein
LLIVSRKYVHVTCEVREAVIGLLASRDFVIIVVPLRVLEQVDLARRGEGRKDGNYSGAKAAGERVAGKIRAREGRLLDVKKKRA